MFRLLVGTFRFLWMSCLTCCFLLSIGPVRASGLAERYSATADSLEEVGNVVEGAQVRWRAGESFLDGQDIPAALEAFRQASSVFEAVEDRLSLAQCFLSMAEGHLLQGEKAEAGQFLAIAGHNLEGLAAPRLKARMQYLEALIPLDQPLIVQALNGTSDAHPPIGLSKHDQGAVSAAPAEGGISPVWFLLAIPLVLLPFGLWFFAIQATQKERNAHLETDALRKEMMGKAAQMERENAVLRARIHQSELAAEQAEAEAASQKAEMENELAILIAGKKGLEDRIQTQWLEQRTRAQEWEKERSAMASSHQKEQLGLLLQTMKNAAEHAMKLQEKAEQYLSQVPEDQWKEDWQTLVRAGDLLPWAVFDQKFEACYPGFLKGLSTQFPALTDHDLRLCSLLMLDLPSKDMAHLLLITSHAVDVARYRLRKKMDLERGQSFGDIFTKT